MFTICIDINEESKHDATASAAEVLTVNKVLDWRARFKRTKVTVFGTMN